MIQQFHSGYIPKENKNTNSKRYMRLYVHFSIIYRSQDTVTLLSYKKNEILPFMTTWVVLKGIMLSEISQTEKYCTISLVCGI